MNRIRQIDIVHLSSDDDQHINCIDQRTGELLAMEIVPQAARDRAPLDEPRFPWNMPEDAATFPLFQPAW